MFWSVPALWPGETVYIVAGGESASSQNLELLRNKRVILINSSYERLECFKSDLPGPRVPAADFLIFGDNRWWVSKSPNHKHNILGLPCKLVSVARMAVHPQVLLLRKNAPPGLATNRKCLTMRRTTLTAAINLAAMLVEPEGSIVLIGADGKFGPNGERNHHLPHQWKHIDGCWQRHHDELETMVEPLKALGVSVLNASPGSAWADLWPVVSLEDCINGDAIEMARKAALAEKAQQLVLRSDTMNGGPSALHVIGGWPQQALINARLIAFPPPEVVVDGKKITLCVANGFASYLMKRRIGGDWLCVKGESEFIPADWARPA